MSHIFSSALVIAGAIVFHGGSIAGDASGLYIGLPLIFAGILLFVCGEALNLKRKKSVQEQEQKKKN